MNTEFLSFGLALEAIRILSITAISFVIALSATPVVVKLLQRFGVKKQIRTSEEAPIFSALHKKKEGTPTMGGIIIWGTVIVTAAIFWILDIFFDGTVGSLNFIDRGETYLPIAAMVFAALLGLFDDVLGVLRLGGTKSGGL